MPKIYKFSTVALLLLSGAVSGCTAMKALDHAGDEFAQGNVIAGLWTGTMGVVIGGIMDVVTLGGATDPETGLKAITDSEKTYQADRSRGKSSSYALASSAELLAKRAAPASSSTSFASPASSQAVAPPSPTPSSPANTASFDPSASAPQSADHALYHTPASEQASSPSGIPVAAAVSSTADGTKGQPPVAKNVPLPTHRQCVKQVDVIPDSGVEGLYRYAVQNVCSRTMQVHWCDGTGCTNYRKSALLAPGAKHGSWFISVQHDRDGIEGTACMESYEGRLIYYDKKENRCKLRG